MTRAVNHQKNILDLVRLILTPVIRFALRHTLPFQAFENLAKEIYVDLAAEEIERQSQKVNSSRVSCLTGLHRREVGPRLNGTMTSRAEARPLGFVARVVGRWEGSKRFCDKAGKPRVITCEGPQSEFHDLVSSITQNINPGTVLFELIRNGAAERTATGLKLLRGTAALGTDAEESFALLGKDINDLIRSVEGNVASQARPGNLHMRTEYDNVHVASVPELKSWLIREGRNFHKKIRSKLSQFDADLGASRGGEGGARIGLTSFVFTELPTAKDAELSTASEG